MNVQFLDPRLPQRFWDKVTPEPNSGCWLWTASVGTTGYGQFGWRGKPSARAHRVSYQELVGEVPMTLVLDHLCRTPICVNPAHLEPVTSAENTRRGASKIASSIRAARTTHCPAGHAYDGDNLYVSRGSRHCVTCCRVRGSAFDHAKAIKRPNSRQRIAALLVDARGHVPDRGATRDEMLAMFDSIERQWREGG